MLGTPAEPMAGLAMDEVDMVARLSGILDTQSIALTDEGDSTNDMINKLSEQIQITGATEDDGVRCA